MYEKSIKSYSFAVLRKTLFVFFVVMFCAALVAAQEPEMSDMEIASLEQLNALFKKYQYTPKDWQAGIREVPRIYLADIPSDWRKQGSKKVTVQDKKRIFFRLLAPIVLYVNEKILEDRERLIQITANIEHSNGLSDDDHDWLIVQANRYLKPSPDRTIDNALIEELLPRMDIVPPSLALAQGAVESGWGTSRFADEGNSLFGQWSWSGGIKPAEQRDAEHGDHRIAAFESTGLSVWSYMLNLNTHNAYESFRQKRAELRVQGKSVRGKDLVATMTAYSERGEDYVKELKTIMRQNKLDPADDASLKRMAIIRLIPGVE